MKKVAFVLAIFSCSFTFAQGVIVSGKVIDGSTGTASLAFVSVKVKGTDISTETDINGDYRLTLLEGNYRLIFDFVGYESLELKQVIGGHKELLLDPVVMRNKYLSADLAIRQDQ